MCNLGATIVLIQVFPVARAAWPQVQAVLGQEPVRPLYLEQLSLPANWLDSVMENTFLDSIKVPLQDQLLLQQPV